MKISTSPSKEVAGVARIIGNNVSTTTGSNILIISLETKLNPRTRPMSKFYDMLHQPAEIPRGSVWRMNLLENYVKIRGAQRLACDDTEYSDSLIESFCST